MIFNWISRCWGGMGISTRYQKARINCTIADWTVPYQDDILILITSFQDKNPQIPAKTAINIFLSHLQTDQQKAHPAFLLKHLYVLDHCVQEMTALDIIGYYYNSNLTMMKSTNSAQLNDSRSPLRQLINSYYSYLITKARTFGHYQKTYFSKDIRPDSISLLQTSAHNIQTKTYDDKLMPSQLSLPNGSQFDFVCSSGRKKRSKQCTKQQRSILSLFEKQTSYNSIFDIIQKCQQLQKLIMQMNRSYQSGNRRVQLIKYIFIMCLWTFIRCYVIVSVGIKYLFRHFLTMSLKQLERFIKTFQYFNNEYTAQFIRFVQSNKNEIQIFKQINYNQLTYVNKDGMRILLDYKQQLKSKQSPNNNNKPIINSTKLLSSKRTVDLQQSVKSISNQPINNNEPIYPTISDEIDDRKVLQLPHQIHVKIKENMKIFYKPRKNMDFCLMPNQHKIINQPYVYQDKFEQYQMEDYFFNHRNFYHQQFIAENNQQNNPNGEANNNINGSRSQLSSSKIKQQQQQQQKIQNMIKQNTSQNNQQQQILRPKRKLSIDKQIEYSEKQENNNKKTVRFADDAMNILDSNSQHKSIQPIKQSQMRQIKQMFQHKRKPSKQFSTWQTWENQYGQNTDSIIIKN